MKSFLRAITPTPLWNAAGAAKRRLVPRSQRSYSGNGEDLLIAGWFRHYGCDLSQVRYVDVGANDPTFLSNTFLFYEAGASGLLIEPDPELAALLRSKRPRDIVINAGVAFDDRRTATLFRMTSRGFNTFSRAQADKVVAASRSWAPEARQDIIGEASIPLLPLNDVISAHVKEPAFVSIDTEGFDLAILRTLDPGLLSDDARMPCFICVEASAPLADFSELVEPAGFEFAARTPDNWIFRRHPERFAAASRRDHPG
jgi:FkbM family methyltransferase